MQTGQITQTYENRKTGNKYIKDFKEHSISPCIVTKILLSILIIYEEWYMELRGGIPYLLQILAVLIVISSIFEMGKKIPMLIQNRVFVFWGIFGIVAFIYSGLFGISETNSTSSLFTYFSFLIVCLCAGMVSEVEKNTYWINAPIIVIVILSAYCSITNGYQRLNDDSTVISMSSNNNPNNLGLMMDIGLFSLLFPQKRQRFIQLLLRLGLAVVSFYVILRTGSRSALVAAVFITVFAAYLYIKFASGKPKEIIIKRVIVIGLGVTAALVLITYMKNHGSSGTSISRLRNGFSWSAFVGRTDLYEEAWGVFSEHPIFGIGYDCFRLINSRSYFTHSTYMELLSCTGFVGFAIFLYPVFIGLHDNIRFAYKDKGRRLALLIMLILSGFFGILYYTIVFMMMLYLIIYPTKTSTEDNSTL